MKILLDAIPLQSLMTGISRYLRNLYTHLLQLEDVDVTFFNPRQTFGAMPEQADPNTWISSSTKAWQKIEPLVLTKQIAYWMFYEYRLNAAKKKL